MPKIRIHSTLSPQSNVLLAMLFLLIASWGGIRAAHSSDGSSDLQANEQQAEDILRELVEFESTGDKPEETKLALQAMATRLINAGFSEADVLLLNPYPGAYGLVARYRGMATQGPLLTLAHIDVVTADPNAWAFPPFSFGKKDGYYFGRGTQDNKTGVAHLVTNFIRLKEENFVPNRDLIMALTGDEETEMKVIEWMTGEGLELIRADFAINSDAGGGELDEEGKPTAFWVQTSEKLYQTYRISASNSGGHSSLPRPDNAINQLSRALVRIADHQFPVELGVDTRMMLEREAHLSDPNTAEEILAVTQRQDPEAAQSLSRDPVKNALLRTTCVVTQIEGGHAENALPRSASATINCRILPGTHSSDVETTLRQVVDDEEIVLKSIYAAVPSPASPLPGALLETIESLVDQQWPGVMVVPNMSTGATDGLYVRNAGIPVYGIGGWFMHPGEIRAHGLDEKISIKRFQEGSEFWYRMLKEFSH